MAESVVDARDLMRQLDKLDDIVKGEVLQLTALAAAKPITNQWKDNIIDWPLVDTGTYHRSVHEVVFQEESGDDLAVVAIGPDINDPPYPLYLEFGTSKMTPKPVGRNAFDEKQVEAKKEGGEVFWELLRQRLK